MNLLSVSDKLANLEHSSIQFAALSCLNNDMQFLICQQCQSICPNNAIVPGNPTIFKKDNCTSCQACLPSCPTGAFQADDDVSNLLNCVTRIEGKSIELLCERHPNPESGLNPETTGLRVRGCLAGLGSGALLALAAMGLEQVTLRTDSCHQCNWQDLSKTVHRQTEMADAFLSGWKDTLIVRCVDSIEEPVERPFMDVKNPPLSRRDLFRMIGRQGQAAVARAMESSRAANGHRLGRDRLRILAAITHLPKPDFPDQVCLDGLDFAVLSINDTCTACGTCARACSTDALSFNLVEDGKKYELRFNPRNCTGCEICTHVCTSASITVDHHPAYGQVFGEEAVLLSGGELVKCDRCGTRTAKRDGASLCPICEYRRENPFGSKLPPGIRKNL